MINLKNSKLVNGLSRSPNLRLIIIVYLAVGFVVSTIKCDEAFSIRSTIPAETASSYGQNIFQYLTAYLGRLSLSSLFNLYDSPKRAAIIPPSTSGSLECGKKFKSHYEGRIVGGHMTSVAEFPWMVSLQREKRGWFGYKAFYHSCGGSLIASSWILTAAHCLYDRDEPMRAVAGTDNLNYLYRSQTRSTSRQIVHPKFDLTTYDNDIALVKTNQPFNLASTFSHVDVVCLEPNIQVQPYDIATICGFGSRAFHERTRSHLYETEIAIIDEKVCNRSFEGLITNNMICAGGMIANKRDACSGDSGGPLLMEVQDEAKDSKDKSRLDYDGYGHMTLVGVVSFGNDCAMQNFPGIYTKVSNYYNWILEQIDEPLARPRSSWNY